MLKLADRGRHCRLLEVNVDIGVDRDFNNLASTLDYQAATVTPDASDTTHTSPKFGYDK